VFGRVTAGMEAVEAIEGLETDSSDRPLEPPRIESIELDPA
jgi:cyclophilin family peptidyl-prolyl cis-trans isomerase